MKGGIGFLKKFFHSSKTVKLTLAGMAHLVEHLPMHQKVSSLVPVQGTCPG